MMSGAGGQLGHHIRETLPMAFILQPPEEQTDNWDDDFEGGISFTKLQGTLQYWNVKMNFLIELFS